MITVFLLTVATASLGAGTLLAVDVTTTAPQVAPAKPEKERLVCRTQERLGTRLGNKRVCNTKARWAEIESESGAAVRDAQRTMGSLPTNGT
jgi:hypothetical protein